MKRTIYLLSILTVGRMIAHAVVPEEVPVATRPQSEYLRWNGAETFAYLGRGSVVFFNSNLNTREISGIVTSSLDNAFAMLNDRLIVGGYKAFNSGKVSNYIAEYQLSGFSSGLPSTATKTYETWWNDTGRGVQVLKTTKGGVVVVGIKWKSIYNISVAYRSPSGSWSFAEKTFGEWANSSPSFGLQIQEGRDGDIYCVIPRDSFHALSLIRLRENDGGISIKDFRFDFLYDQCSFIFTQVVCRDGIMTPHPEIPYLKSSMTPDGRMFLSYQGANAILGCAYTITRPVITEITTMPQPHDGRILGIHIQNPLKPQIVYVTYQSVPGVSYALQFSENLTSWRDLKSLDTGSVDMVATNTVSKVRAFLSGEQRGNFRVLARSYIRTPLVEIAERDERVTKYVPMHPIADGLLYWPPENYTNSTSDCETRLHFRKFDYPTKTEVNESVVDYNLKAWGDDVPWVVVERTNGYSIKRL